jgi:hypothetical protein
VHKELENVIAYPKGRECLKEVIIDAKPNVVSLGCKLEGLMAQRTSADAVKCNVDIKNVALGCPSNIYLLCFLMDHSSELVPVACSSIKL